VTGGEGDTYYVVDEHAFGVFDTVVRVLRFAADFKVVASCSFSVVELFADPGFCGSSVDENINASCLTRVDLGNKFAPILGLDGGLHTKTTASSLLAGVCFNVLSKKSLLLRHSK